MMRYKRKTPLAQAAAQLQKATESHEAVKGQTQQAEDRVASTGQQPRMAPPRITRGMEGAIKEFWGFKATLFVNNRA